ncbi:MAG TPA: zf-HC2 domain-containing protein [Gemmatimonadaceae bacterium]|nr:zf-HC2 domain-containing protein [Gemmatimonadaceae bacterium]
MNRSGAAACAAFEARLADYLEGDLPPAQRAAAERHLAACPACSALVADLQALRDEARALPPLQPSRDLWDGIARRIETPVVALPARRAAEPSWLRRPWLAAAAVALLMAGSAGITYQLTARTRTGAPDAPAPRPIALAPRLATQPAGPDSAVATPVTAAAPETPAPTRPAPAAGSTPARLAANGAAPTVALEAYDAEIAQLRRVLDERRASLDTATVRILEQNLVIIDRAIRESRAALARDPASRLLYQQLNAALDTKLELMRTAVLLTTD